MSKEGSKISWNQCTNYCWMRQSYRRDKKPLSVESCWSDLPPRELLLGFGVVEYFGGYLMKRRSSSFLIHLRSLVIAVMAQAFVTRGLKQVYSSNLLVTCIGEENRYFQWGRKSVTVHMSVRIVWHAGKHIYSLFLLRVRWEERYCCLICSINMKLQPGASLFSWKQRET